MAYTYGSGVSPDSVIYLDAAKSLLKGDGLFAFGQPVTHYPPGFSIILALIVFFLDDLLLAVRFLNAFAFALNLGLVAWIIYLATDYSFPAVITSIILFIFSTPLIVIHAMAWSEPLFILFSITTILFLSLYVTRPRWIWLFVAAFFLSMALLTRYAGIALLPASLLVLWRWSGLSLKDKIRVILVFIGFACLSLGLFVIRNTMIAGSATNRSFVFHPVALSGLNSLVDTFYLFLIPIRVVPWLRWMTIGLISILLIIELIVMRKHYLIRVNVN